MVPSTKEELRKLVSETTIEMYEEMTPQLIRLMKVCMVRSVSSDRNVWITKKW